MSSNSLRRQTSWSHGSFRAVLPTADAEAEELFAIGSRQQLFYRASSNRGGAAPDAAAEGGTAADVGADLRISGAFPLAPLLSQRLQALAARANETDSVGRMRPESLLVGHIAKLPACTELLAWHVVVSTQRRRRRPPVPALDRGAAFGESASPRHFQSVAGESTTRTGSQHGQV